MLPKSKCAQSTLQPSPDSSAHILICYVLLQAKCMEKDMLILTTSIYDTLRLIPPLNVTKEDMAKGIQIIKEAVEEVAEGEKPQEAGMKGQALE